MSLYTFYMSINWEYIIINNNIFHMIDKIK